MVLTGAVYSTTALSYRPIDASGFVAGVEYVTDRVVHFVVWFRMGCVGFYVGEVVGADDRNSEPQNISLQVVLSQASALARSYTSVPLP